MLVVNYFCPTFYNTFWNGKEVALLIANIQKVFCNTVGDGSLGKE